MNQAIASRLRITVGFLLLVASACGKEAVLAPVPVSPSIRNDRVRHSDAAVFVEHRISEMNRMASGHRGARIPPGEYLYIVSQTTSIGGIKNAPGLEIAAVPVTASGVVKPTYTFETKLGWVYTPGEVSYCFPAVANGIVVSGNHVYVADGYATADPKRRTCSKSHTNEIRVYSIEDQGEPKPQRVISGDRTFLFERDYINNPTEPTGALTIGNDGSLYVGFLSQPEKLTEPSVLVFSPNAHGNVAPRLIFLRIEDQAGRLESAAVPSEATDGASDLGVSFVPNSGSGCVEFATIPQDANGVAKPITQFVPEESFPSGIAMKRTTLYAAMLGILSKRFIPGGVASYDILSPATPMPGLCRLPAMHATRYIHGDKTGLKNPLDVVRDNRGHLYVLSEERALDTVDIATFEANADGNVRPLRYARVIIRNTAPGGLYPNRLALGRVP